MPTRIEVNVITGERKEVELTPAEILDAADRTAAELAIANSPEMLRKGVDESERIAAKQDAQILGDINMDAATVATTIDTIFNTLSVTQRTFLKRLVRVAQVGARIRLRNGG